MTRWARAVIRGFGAVCALALSVGGPAVAGSRFETSPQGETKASVSLDFTIIIPEVVYLGPAPPGAGETPSLRLPIRPPAAGPKALPEAGPYVALSNAGTLAFAPAGAVPMPSPENGREARPSAPPPIGAYVVAMP